MDKQDIKVSSVIQLYVTYQEDLNHSPKTVRWYSDIRRFSEWLGQDATIKDIKNDAIRDYLRNIRDRGFSKFTNHAYARTLKTFIRWLGREGYVGEMAYRAVEMPKVAKYEDVTDYSHPSLRVPFCPTNKICPVTSSQPIGRPCNEAYDRIYSTLGGRRGRTYQVHLRITRSGIGRGWFNRARHRDFSQSKQ